MVSFKLSLRYLFILCLLLSATTLRAQESSEALRNSIRTRAGAMANATTKRLSEETKRFNAHIAEINNARPLEVAYFDSTHLASNVLQVMDFLSYLKQTRAASDSLAQSLEDTLFALRNDSPGGRLDKALEVFSATFTADRNAFNNYLATLNNVYDQVLNVLLFMQHSKYTVVKNSPEFHSHEEVLEYKKLMKAVDKAMKDYTQAAKAATQATDLANQKMKEWNASNKETSEQ